MAIHLVRLAGNGLAIRRAVDWGAIIGSGVGSRSTRQVEGQAFAYWLAGMSAVCKSPPGLACIAGGYFRILEGDGRAARERVKPESDKTVNAGECP